LVTLQLARPRWRTSCPLASGRFNCNAFFSAHPRKDFILQQNYVDPDRWQPLICNFRHYYGLGRELGKTFRAEV